MSFLLLFSASCFRRRLRFGDGPCDPVCHRKTEARRRNVDEYTNLCIVVFSNTVGLSFWKLKCSQCRRNRLFNAAYPSTPCGSAVKPLEISPEPALVCSPDVRSILKFVICGSTDVFGRFLTSDPGVVCGICMLIITALTGSL